ncbi:unnamed protein product [Urochloa humidicola]
MTSAGFAPNLCGKPASTGPPCRSRQEHRPPGSFATNSDTAASAQPRQAEGRRRHEPPRFHSQAGASRPSSTPAFTAGFAPTSPRRLRGNLDLASLASDVYIDLAGFADLGGKHRLRGNFDLAGFAPIVYIDLAGFADLDLGGKRRLREPRPRRLRDDYDLIGFRTGPRRLHLGPLATSASKEQPWPQSRGCMTTSGHHVRMLTTYRGCNHCYLYGRLSTATGS